MRFDVGLMRREGEYLLAKSRELNPFSLTTIMFLQSM